MEQLCWTTMNILPDFRALLPDFAITLTDPDLMAKLGVYIRYPPVERVVEHCTNISEPLGTFVKGRSFDSDGKYFVIELLEHVYGFLLRNSSKDLIRKHLQCTPLIYIPCHDTLVKGSSIVINLSKDCEITPYLYKSPSEFGKYNDLFVTIGANTDIVCDHYIYLLEQLKQEVQDDDLSKNALDIATRAVGALLQLITKENAIGIRGTVLFFPNKSKKLTNANELVVCDNENILERIWQADLDLKFCIGFQDHGVNVKNPIGKMLLLPENMRPQFLTNVIKENVVEDHFIVEEVCEVSQQLEDCIHSEDFLEGLLRILQNDNSDTIDNIDQTLRDTLQKVSIRRAHGLQTVCSYNGSVIPGSEQNKKCYIQEQTDGNSSSLFLYFQAEIREINEVILEKDGLINLIEKIIGTSSLNIRLLTNILFQYKKCETIKSILDREGIRSYHLLSGDNRSTFPKPGTNVDVKFHPFLEHDIRPFDEQEYIRVALEQYDVDSNHCGVDCEPTYIYVKIIGKETNDDCERDEALHLKYRVDIGEKHSAPVVVPIFRLYRFIRPQRDENTKEDITFQQSRCSLSFDENCQNVEIMIKEAWKLPVQERKTILKRLMLKWHPDKNPLNQECCKDVFQFMMSVIGRLEVQAECDTTNDRDVFQNSPYQRMSEAVHRRASEHSRVYRSNIIDYSRSFFDSEYFSHTSREKRADPVESRRWWRQAEQDFLAADLCFQDVGSVDGYNWICYMCHQATEKVLKAAVYNSDANSQQLWTHCLSAVALSVDSKPLLEKVRQLEARLCEHTRMRYPDRTCRPKTPSEVYGEDDARFALDQTKEIIDMVEDLIPS